MTTTWAVSQTEGLNWNTWASFFIGNNPTLTTLPRPGAEGDWKTWARELVWTLQLNSYQVPGPDAFDRWQDWVPYLSMALVASL